MPRLPQPGKDNGQWGDILNDFLSQSHDVTGNLKTDTVGAPQLKPQSVTASALVDGAVTSAKLAPNTISTAGASGDYADLTNKPAIPVVADDINAEPAGLSDATKAQQLAAFASAIPDASSTLPAFATIRNALKAGRSCAIWGSGDSTMDASSSDNRPMENAARIIAVKYPNLRIVSYTRDGSTEKWRAPNILQAGASGRRYARLTSRSLRYRTAIARQFTTGNVDVAALISPDSWTAATSRIIVCRSAKGDAAGDGTAATNELQFDLRLSPTGALVARWSATGTTWVSDKTSTVAITPPATDEFLWVRATIELNLGGSYFVKFYTSPENDGVTWTQLGTQITAVSASTMWTVADDAFFEIGAQRWQPANNPFVGRIAEVKIRDGVDGALVTPVLPESWERYPDAATTFGGSQTLTILNAARAGMAMSYHVDAVRIVKETPDYGQSVLLFCNSHNEVGKSGQIVWLTPYLAWVNAVKALLPNTAVAVIKQNPHTSAWVNEAAYGVSHVIRMDELDRLASTQGWSVVDLFSTFLNDTRGLSTLINADGLHPSDATGYPLSGTVLARAIGA